MLKQSVWTTIVASVLTTCCLPMAMALSPAEAKIRAALSDNTEVEFIETPIETVVEYLQDLHGIPLVIDQPSLDSLGISSDEPITKNLRGISLRSTLNIMLRDLELTWVIRDEVLIITSVDAAEKYATARVYDITPLLKDVEDASAIAEQFQAAVGSSAAAEGKEPHAKKRYFVIGSKLVVRAPTPEQYRVEALLKELTGEKVESVSPRFDSDTPRRKPMPEGAPGGEDPFDPASDPGSDPFGDAPGDVSDDPFGGSDPFGDG